MIDWSQVEVGDVVEFRDGTRDEFQEFHKDKPPSQRLFVNLKSYMSDGRRIYSPRCLVDDEDDIVAIHKKGTVGAMSHEERSRLWDCVAEHSLDVVWFPDGTYSVFDQDRRYIADGATPLEAVAACVAAIEAKENAK